MPNYTIIKPTSTKLISFSPLFPFSSHPSSSLCKVLFAMFTVDIKQIPKVCCFQDKPQRTHKVSQVCNTSILQGYRPLKRTEGEESVPKLPIILTVGNPTPTLAYVPPVKEGRGDRQASGHPLGWGEKENTSQSERGELLGNAVSGTHTPKTRKASPSSSS